LAATGVVWSKRWSILIFCDSELRRPRNGRKYRCTYIFIYITSARRAVATEASLPELTLTVSFTCALITQGAHHRARGGGVPHQNVLPLSLSPSHRESTSTRRPRRASRASGARA
jgi:hypothetical protein